ncbi:hypothetical protein DL89DRAFT_265292, partial [Linderina pennispora]
LRWHPITNDRRLATQWVADVLSKNPSAAATWIFVEALLENAGIHARYGYRITKRNLRAQESNGNSSRQMKVTIGHTNILVIRYIPEGSNRQVAMDYLRKSMNALGRFPTGILMYANRFEAYQWSSECSGARLYCMGKTDLFQQCDQIMDYLVRTAQTHT